jgi:hypothetical protein
MGDGGRDRVYEKRRDGDAGCDVEGQMKTWRWRQKRLRTIGKKTAGELKCG